jgi:hypothetical protein
MNILPDSTRSLQLRVCIGRTGARGCGAPFHGHHWQLLCPTCERWRAARVHIRLAAAAVKGRA